MRNENSKWDFFIAHAGADKAAAEILYELLSPHSKVFLDSRCLLYGDDWGEELVLAQGESLVSVVLVSAQTQRAYYQREEIAAAIDMARKDSEKHRVVPVYIDEQASASNVPYGLRLKHSLSVPQLGGYSPVAENLLKLLAQLKKTVWKTSTEQKQKELRVQPYAMAEHMLWSAFQRGEFIPVSGSDWYTNFTIPIPDAISHMWQVCRRLNPNCQRVITEKQTLLTIFMRLYYTIEFRSEDFIVISECKQKRGSVLNPLRVEIANTYDVHFKISAREALIREIVAQFKKTSPKSKIIHEG